MHGRGAQCSSKVKDQRHWSGEVAQASGAMRGSSEEERQPHNTRERNRDQGSYHSRSITRAEE